MEKSIAMLLLFLGIMISCASGTAIAQTSATNIAKEKAQKNVAILLFNDVQVIDYAGPYEVFSEAAANNFARFNIYMVSETGAPITTIGGMTVLPKYAFGKHPQPDVLVIPGGWGVYEQRKNPRVIAWIQENAKQAQVVFSICNGAFLLSKAGLLDGLSATTTARGIDRLKDEVPGLKPVYDKRYVDNGKIVTAGGLSAGIDGALHVVEKILGKGWAQQVSTDMEYNWQPESRYSRALLADKYLPPVWVLLPNTDIDPLIYEGSEDKWESKSIVQTKLSPAQVLEQINGKLPNLPMAKWSQEDSGRPQTPQVQSAWTFTDAKGKAWKALINIQPFSGETSKLIVTIRIALGDSARASNLNQILNLPGIMVQR